VNLIDKYDHLITLANLTDDRLEPLLELTAVLGSRHDGGKIKCGNTPILENLGHFVLDDPLRESLGNCRLTHTRLPDEYWIVFLAAAEHLDNAFNFCVAADDRVELVLPGHLREVAAELIEIGRFALVFFHPSCFRVGGWTEQLEDLFAHAFAIDAELGENLRRHSFTLPNQPEEQVFGAHVVVAEQPCLFDGQFQHAFRARGEGNFSDRERSPRALDHAFDGLLDLLEIQIQLAEDLRGNSFSLAHYAEQQVLGANIVVLETPCFVASKVDHFPDPICESILHANILRSDN